MLVGIAAVLAIVLFALLILPKNKPTDSSPFPTFLSTPTLIQSGPIRPEASAWSKQTAADMLDEIALADERAKVIETMRRAVEFNASLPPKPAAPPPASPAASVVG